VDTVEVTLKGFDGWAIPLIIAGSLIAVWLISYLIWGKLDPSVRIKPGTEYVGWNWIIRQFYGFAFMIAAFVVIIGTQGQANAWNEQQRIEALKSIGIEGPVLLVNARGHKLNDWAGKSGEDYLVGHFSQIEGEQWIIVGGRS
jgi:hypothetical protein